MTARDGIEPPSDDLRALFAAERDVSAAERAAIRDKLAVSIAAPAPATAAIATTKLAWIAAAVIATAAGIWWLARDRAPDPARVPAPQIAPPALAHEPTITATAAQPAVTAPDPEQPVASRPFAAKHPSQAELLARAWKALATDPAEVLRLVDFDANLHPIGALAEEREALRVQALEALDRRDEARERATKFLARYPNSVHRKRVEAVLP